MAARTRSRSLRRILSARAQPRWDQPSGPGCGTAAISRSRDPPAGAPVLAGGPSPTAAQQNPVPAARQPLAARQPPVARQPLAARQPPVAQEPPAAQRPVAAQDLVVTPAQAVALHLTAALHLAVGSRPAGAPGRAGPGDGLPARAHPAAGHAARCSRAYSARLR